MTTDPPIPNVLIVEDEMLVAALMVELTEELGCQVLGPTPDLDEALAISGQHEVDFAILDINVRGKSSYPVADALKERSIPFIFTTGYNVSQIDNPYDCLVISKPFEPKSFQRIAAGQLGLPLQID